MKISTYWTVKHIRNGQVIWEDTIKNTLANEGAEMILEEFFRQDVTYVPTTFYIRLCNDSLQVTDTLSTILNEPPGYGYAAQAVPASLVGFPTKDIDTNGKWRLTSVVVTFTAAAGNIGPVSTAFLATSSDNSGKLVAYLPLSMTRTVLDTDSMTYYFQISLGN